MANREQRRRQKIKSEKKIIPVSSEENMFGTIKLVLIVIGLFAVFYIITVFVSGNYKFDNKTNNNDDNTTPAVIQYDEILAGETFKMQNAEYFVMFYDFTGSDASLYQYFMSQYKSNHTNGLKIYTVDLSKGFNIQYVSEVSNPSATNIDNLKVKGPTLINIKDGSVTSYVEGKDAIKSKLQ